MMRPARRYRERLHDSHEQEENIRKETNPSVEPRRQVSAFALGAILGVLFILHS